MTRFVALLLTVFTGFSGLAYEVTWEKYLATLLGSHSEATAAVLGIFLGGLSVGYAVFGRVTRGLVARADAAGRPPRLLLAYGLVEAGIGLYVLAFPLLFRAVQALSLAVPHGVAGLGFAFDVGLATLLIGPPTLLMGGTIPMLTQALARSLDDATRFHAYVYGLNTVGAFAGALAAGFVLIPQLGLVGVMRAMGAVNLAAGALFVWLGRRGGAVAVTGAPAGLRRPAGFRLCAAVALLTGFAMMAVQTTLIRLGGLSFGSSPFTFSMVVAVFVLCIALGSLAVSAFSRIPPALVLVNQLALAALLGLLFSRLPEAPYWAHLMRSWFRDTDAAFPAFYLTGFLGVLLFVGPPVILSGASLPLLFHHLRRQMGELGAVAGSLYSWNTVGSLLGALLGGYALLFWLDLHHVYALAMGAVLVSAALLARVLFPSSRLAVAGLLVLALAAGALLPAWEPQLLSSGLFRFRSRHAAVEGGIEAFLAWRRQVWQIDFYDDDPTASVAVLAPMPAPPQPDRSILVNGKADGAVAGDYPTMALAGLVPALLSEAPRRAFVIGYGTGVTAGELAALEEVEQVVVAEISPGVIEAAPLFDFANFGASDHPKVEIVRSDAYRALLRSPGTWDVIVSEPSNPWVAGVEMLFSREFLEAARDRLTPGGVYAQWFHQYETDAKVVELVLRTYASVFERVSVWYTMSADLILLGFGDGVRALDVARLEQRAGRPDFAAGLTRAGVTSFGALLAHELLPVGVLHAARPSGPLHTLLHPRLTYAAGRAFFRGGAGELPFTGAGAAAEVGQRNALLRRHAERSGGALPPAVRAEVAAKACQYRTRLCATLLADWWREAPESEAFQAAFAAARRTPGAAETLTLATLSLLAELLPGTEAGGRGPVGPGWARRATNAFQQYYQHAAPFAPGHLLALWDRCRAPQGNPAACEQGAARARQLLAGNGGAAP